MIVIQAALHVPTAEVEQLAREESVSGRVKLRSITWKEGFKSFVFDEIALTESAGYVNMAYRCTACGHEGDELEARDDIKDTRTCPSCQAATYIRVPVAAISTSKTSVSIPDGVSKRFSKLKDKRKIAKEKRAEHRERIIKANKYVNKQKRAREKA